MAELYTWLAIFLFSSCMTYLLRIYALKKNVIDVPNARSSHSVPTPRGGGMAIVLAYSGVLALSGWWWLFAAGLLVAIVGWLDDQWHVKPLIRLQVHIMSCAMVVYAAGGLPAFSMFGLEMQWGLAGSVLAVIALAWILNLYNFMDGIDGIAGVEAVTTAGVAGLILWFVYGGYDLAWLHLYLAAGSLGFLLWNWPPAKIFLGDAGSGFLGLMLGALTILSASYVAEMLWVWLILLGVFIVDATFTLTRRLLRGDKVYEAHRSHGYQYASRLYGHKAVTLAVLAINLLWLAPIALTVAMKHVDGAWGLLMAYAPLTWLAWNYKAGELEAKQV